MGYGLLVAAAAVALWIWWAEDHPRDERRLRVLVHEHLDQWFPREMTPEDGWHGLHLRFAHPGAMGPRVVLLHGLDEPGSIWDDLVPALGSAGYEVWELRYPNDQGIDRSSAFLAEHWPELPADRPAVLIGHSMGGLLARDFVSRWRHPVGAPARMAGAPVMGAILVGTPNHGSEWARLRVWLELRDQFLSDRGRRFSLFAALRDGTGEAKLDLRPGSDFLAELNARSWPESVPVRLIAGRLGGASGQLEMGIDAAAEETRCRRLGQRLDDWWSGLGDGLGDGVVALDSVRLANVPPPQVVDASHRGMLLRLLPSDPQPPAIPRILDILDAWRSPGTSRADKS